MTTELVKWASNDGQITKSKLSDGRRAKFLPSAKGSDYNWLRFKRYLENVGSTIRGVPTKAWGLAYLGIVECRLNRAEKRRQLRLARKSRRLAPAGAHPTSHAPDIQLALGLASQHYNAGRLAEAEALYQQILQADPDQPMVLHILGVIAHRMGKNDIAVDRITRALAVKPDFVLAYNSLGSALKELGRFDEAVDHYQKALELKPNIADVHFNLGNAKKKLGRLDEAVDHYRKALAIKPTFAEAHINLGNMFLELRRLDEAVDHYQKALDIKPDFAEAHCSLGKAQKELGRLDEAVDHYRKALAIKPSFAVAHSNLGNIFLENGRLEDAIRSFDLAGLDSSRSKILECLFALERYEDFYRRLDKLIAMDTKNIRAAAISAFASQQLDRADPYPFCRKPMDYVRGYEGVINAEGGDGFLHRLVDEMKSRAAIWEPLGKATRQGFQSPAILFTNPNGLLADLDRLIKDKIKIYRAELSSENCVFMNSFPNTLSLSGWMVRLLKGGHHTEHIHPSGWLSGVLYLQVPKTSDREEGSIEFGLWGYDYPVLNSSYPRERYYPENGNLVLFPSSLFHRTIPFDSNEERVSIAFDLIPT